METRGQIGICPISSFLALIIGHSYQEWNGSARRFAPRSAKSIKRNIY
jgi:hypothetical protein